MIVEKDEGVTEDVSQYPHHHLSPSSPSSHFPQVVTETAQVVVPHLKRERAPLTLCGVCVCVYVGVYVYVCVCVWCVCVLREISTVSFGNQICKLANGEGENFGSHFNINEYSTELPLNAHTHTSTWKMKLLYPNHKKR